MTQWTKRILRRKNGKGTVTEADDNNEVKATKLMEFIEASDAKKAKKGIKIRFMHDLGQGTVYWLEGEVEERLTKIEKARRLKYAENFFRIGSLKVINYWGEDPKPLPATVCSNLTSNVGWTIGTEVLLPTDDNSAIEIKPSDIPDSKKEEEVDQENGDETPEDQSDDEGANGALWRVKIMPGINENGTDTESLNNIRLANNKLEDDASTDVSEISDDVNEIRRLRTVHPDD